MGNPQINDSTNQSMSVNVALCGSIPRSTFLNQSVRPCALEESRFYGYHPKDNCPTEHVTNQNCSSILAREVNSRSLLSSRQPLGRICEAPAWAVPAKGETRLEPVCEGLDRQGSVDLTKKSYYRVGRSPVCDIQLLHGTSSRRHAMLFHHSNGSCYLVDCGSAHGTYLNGTRISSPNDGGLVVPHKVRRGAMIRFGGPGAPCFVLKSFSFKLDEVTCSCEESQLDSGELLRLNTRLNALGASVYNKIKGHTDEPFCEESVRRKRSFDSLSTSVTLDEDFEPTNKRTRCISPTLPLESHALPFVSPDVAKRRVHFSSIPPEAFSPAWVDPEFSFYEDNDSI